MNLFKISASGRGVEVKELRIIKETPKTYKVSGGWGSVINKDQIDSFSSDYLGSLATFSVEYNDDKIERIRTEAIDVRNNKIKNLKEEIENLEKPHIYKNMVRT